MATTDNQVRLLANIIKDGKVLKHDSIISIDDIPVRLRKKKYITYDLEKPPEQEEEPLEQITPRRSMRRNSQSMGE